MADARYYKEVTENSYDLGGEYGAGARLNLQHYLFKDLLGYNIHPDITVRNDKDFKIADVGTGTGVWLTDVYKELPLAQFHGFDKTTDDFPPREWLPDNICLQHLDIFQPIPESLLGQYDLVYVRLFMFVVQNDDPGPMLENLVRLLKPGGYLTWVEHNPTDARIESISPGLKSDAWKIIQGLHGGPQALRKFSWVPKLPEYFRSAGLSVVASCAYPQPARLRMPFAHVQLLTGAEFSFNALDNSGPQSTGPSHRKILDEAFREAKSGVAPVWTPIVIVGRKDKRYNERE